MNLLEHLLAGFLLGLANAAHCAGMCGAFAVRAAAPPRRAAGFTLYALGKAFSYVTLGAVAGGLGRKLLRDAGTAQAWAGIVAGAILVVAGLAKLRPGTASRLIPESWAKRLAAPFAALQNADLPGGRFTLGAATGLLPCGVVYLAALQGAATGSALGSVVLMAGFACGTTPVLGLAGLLGGAIRAKLSARALRIAGGALLCVVGALLVFRAVSTCYRVSRRAAIDEEESAGR